MFAFATPADDVQNEIVSQKNDSFIHQMKTSNWSVNVVGSDHDIINVTNYKKYLISATSKPET